MTDSRESLEELTDQVLDLYRQVNLLYRIGDAIAACLPPDALCKVVLRESMKILRARAGIIALDDGMTFGFEPAERWPSLSVPIETAGGRIGALTVYWQRTQPYTAPEEKLLRAVARQAGIALENARLVLGLRRQNKELAELNEELRALDEMKSDFVSNVSHELRTPLSSIKGFAATILDDEEMPGEVTREFVGIIKDESDKLALIINDILDVSKLMSGFMSYVMAPLALEDVLSEVVTLLGVLARERGLSLELEVVDRAQVDGDANRLSQVFKNLVGNALKFTDTGSVGLYQWVSGGQVHVSVTDTGEGITAEELPQIFDKFYRVENVVHTREGTGLGLALVRAIVEHHHGSIEVRSERGLGSVFTVHLPVLGARRASRADDGAE